MAVPLRSPDEIEKLAAAADLAWRAVHAAASALRPGVATLELAERAERCILDAGAVPIFKGYGESHGRPPFPSAACISANDEALHGIPGERVLLAGDIVKIDVGLRLEGWCADTASTFVVPADLLPSDLPPSDLPPADHPPADHPLLASCRGALELALSMMSPGRRWSEVVRAVGEFAQARGAALVAGYDGHGIGRKLHEPPRLPLVLGASGRPPEDEDFTLWPGMVVTVEPTMTLGKPQVHEAANRWTVLTDDASHAAHEERMVAITRHGPRRLCG